MTHSRQLNFHISTPNVNLTVLTEPPDLQVTEKKASYKRNREIFRGRDLVHPYRIGWRGVNDYKKVIILKSDYLIGEEPEFW